MGGPRRARRRPLAPDAPVAALRETPRCCVTPAPRRAARSRRAPWPARPPARRATKQGGASRRDGDARRAACRPAGIGHRAPAGRASAMGEGRAATIVDSSAPDPDGANASPCVPTGQAPCSIVLSHVNRPDGADVTPAARLAARPTSRAGGCLAAWPGRTTLQIGAPECSRVRHGRSGRERARRCGGATMRLFVQARDGRDGRSR